MKVECGCNKTLKAGDKLKLKEKQRWTVQACDERFIIAVKPYNPKRTYMYTIIDLKEKKRSSDNYYCRFDYDDKEECEEALVLLNKTANNENDPDGFWLSHRRVIDLDIERVDISSTVLNI